MTHPLARITGAVEAEAATAAGAVVTAPVVEHHYRRLQEEMDEIEHLMGRVAARCIYLRKWHWTGRIDSVRAEAVLEHEHELLAWYRALMARAAETAAGTWTTDGLGGFDNGAGI